MTEGTAQIRSARASDYPSFVELFAELGVDDPIPNGEKFNADMAPTMLVAERDGQIVGYAYYAPLQGLGYIRHLVVAPGARSQGMGRDLLLEARARCVAAGCTEWCLNVRTSNEVAIRLYERAGMRRVYRTVVLRLSWSLVDSSALAALGAEGASAASEGAPCTLEARAIAAADDPTVEAALDIIPGLIADARRKGLQPFVAEETRVPRGLAADAGAMVAAAIFDPTFPSAFSFRGKTPRAAAFLLRALRAHAERTGVLRPSETLTVVNAGQPEIAAALCAVGAKVRDEMYYLRGSLA